MAGDCHSCFSSCLVKITLKPSQGSLSPHLLSSYKRVVSPSTQASMIPKKPYTELAEEAWEQAWNILQSREGWRREAGHEYDNACVFSRHFNQHGKVFKLVAVVDFTTTEVFDVLVPGVEAWPVWNPTILECKMIEKVNENTDIAYSVAANALGGLVSSRDFVNLRHWKTRDDVLMSSACATKHPKMPVSKAHVRAENKPAAYVFEKVPGEPNKCKFTCILSTDLKGWMPQFLIDQALGGFLLDYLNFLIKHLQNKYGLSS